MSKAFDELQDRIREMEEANARKIADAEAVGRLREVVREEAMYGPFAGGDPRKFSPDPEAATADEMARHAEACKAADEGEGLDRSAHCSYGDNSNMKGQGFGVGVTMAQVRFLQILDEAGKVIAEYA